MLTMRKSYFVAKILGIRTSEWTFRRNWRYQNSLFCLLHFNIIGASQSNVIIYWTYFSAAMKNGLLLGGCGNVSIRLRPTLLFEKRHADEFLDLFEKTLSQVWVSKWVFGLNRKCHFLLLIFVKIWGRWVWVQNAFWAELKADI